ncbi:MAG: hypothetical protein OMOMHJEC_02800 [Xanthomonadales bacterium]|nr:hypothetical protein [Xanthomonadales bacterium]
MIAAGAAFLPDLSPALPDIGEGAIRAPVAIAPNDIHGNPCEKAPISGAFSLFAYWLALTCFITSSAKFSSFFSMPSPTLMRTKELTFAPAFFRTSSTPMPLASGAA